MSATIEMYAEAMAIDVARELRGLMAEAPPRDLTGVELLALLAIFRGAKERIDAQRRPPAPVLQLAPKSHRRPQ